METIHQRVRSRKERMLKINLQQLLKEGFHNSNEFREGILGEEINYPEESNHKNNFSSNRQYLNNIFAISQSEFFACKEHLEFTSRHPWNKKYRMALPEPLQSKRKESSKVQLGVEEERTSQYKTSPKHSLAYSISKRKLSKLSSPRKGLFGVTLNSFTKDSIRQNLINEQQDEKLLRVFNSVFGCNFSRKLHFRIEKSHLSETLKHYFGNDRLIGYFNLEAIEDFNGLKNMLKELSKTSPKERLMIAYLNYDVNNDGVICEKDLYELSIIIPEGSRMNHDLHLIVDNIKKCESKVNQAMNDAGWIQLRSIRHTSFVRNKTTYSRKESRVAKELEMTKKFVTVALRDVDDCESPEERRQQTRKFLITFEDFCEIFAMDPPVFVEEVLDLFNPDKQPEKILIKSVKTEANGSEIRESVYQSLLNQQKLEQETWSRKILKSKSYLDKAKQMKHYLIDCAIEV